MMNIILWSTSKVITIILCISIPTHASCFVTKLIYNTNRFPTSKKFTQLHVSQQQHQQQFLQVISDVDDTIKSSGGVNVAGIALGGIDTQYERGDFYPGVFQFMLELSKHGLITDDNDTTSASASQPPKVAILTARAEEFKVALELKDDSKIGKAFINTGKANGYNGWGLGPVLYGSVAEWVVQNRKGLRKFNNFERLFEQDPTGTIMNYVYIGDVGEYDQEAGETMLREYPQVVKAVFLHVVSSDDTEQQININIPPCKLVNGRPVVFFRTYVGAAANCLRLGYMDVVGLKRVILAAEKELQGVSRNNSKWIDLERDITMAVESMMRVSI